MTCENAVNPIAREKHDGRASSDIVDSDALFRGRRVVLIRHNDGVYSLRTTRAGKLILTK